MYQWSILREGFVGRLANHNQYVNLKLGDIVTTFVRLSENLYPRVIKTKMGLIKKNMLQKHMWTRVPYELIFTKDFDNRTIFLIAFSQTTEIFSIEIMQDSNGYTSTQERIGRRINESFADVIREMDTFSNSLLYLALYQRETLASTFYEIFIGKSAKKVQKFIFINWYLNRLNKTCMKFSSKLLFEWCILNQGVL